MNNFIRDYLVKLYIPRITWTDIIEIVIIAFVIYMSWYGLRIPRHGYCLRELLLLLYSH